MKEMVIEFVRLINLIHPSVLYHLVPSRGHEGVLEPIQRPGPMGSFESPINLKPDVWSLDGGSILREPDSAQEGIQPRTFSLGGDSANHRTTTYKLDCKY